MALTEDTETAASVSKQGDRTVQDREKKLEHALSVVPELTLYEYELEVELNQLTE